MKASDISEKLKIATQNKICTRPCNNIRASEIGHPCERYIVLSITRWQDKTPINACLQELFDLGNAIESETIRRLKESGLEVLTARKNFKIEKPLITGREDILIQDPESGELYPGEIKGLAPYTFDKINSINDMLHHKQRHIRGYPAQLYMYLYHYAKERGYFILYNKLTGAIKPLDVFLDYDYVDGLFQKSTRVYKHIEAKTLPDMIEEESICSNCNLLHICGAKIDRGNALIDTGELEELLLRREELMPKVRELEEVKEQINQTLGNNEKAFTASFMVSSKTITRKAYTAPETSYKKLSIKRIESEETT